MPELLVRTRDHEIVKPGCCVICHSQQRPLVDLEQALDPVFWGRLYLCELCALSVGRAVGCLDPDQAERLRANVRTLEARVAELEAELDAEGDRKVVSMDKLREVVEATVRALLPSQDPARIEEGVDQLVDEIAPKKRRGRGK